MKLNRRDLLKKFGIGVAAVALPLPEVVAAEERANVVPPLPVRSVAADARYDDFLLADGRIVVSTMAFSRLTFSTMDAPYKLEPYRLDWRKEKRREDMADEYDHDDWWSYEENDE